MAYDFTELQKVMDQMIRQRSQEDQTQEEDLEEYSPFNGA
jgi:hypothetical protein